jgi:hypothetical protein
MMESKEELRIKKSNGRGCREWTPWTPEWLANFGSAEDWLEQVCDAHNSALAANDDKWRDQFKLRKIWRHL